ncbi:MAG: hypothetical protein AAFY26_04215 [Cyanobacteria bacterium J06638_22]
MMQYSMSARFQGAMLGAVAGAYWRQGRLSFHPEIAAIEEGAGNFGGVERVLSTANALSQHLITHDTRDIPWHLWDLPSGSVGDRSTQIALLTLPLALYYHDNAARFHDCLQETVQAWGIPLEAIYPATVLREILAIAFRDPLKTSQLTQPILSALHPNNAAVAFPEAHWRWLDAALSQRQSLAIACSTLPSIPHTSTSLAIALLVFLTSPTDGAQALARAATASSSALTAALVGILAGCYNSIATFPDGCRGGGDRSASSPVEPSQSSNVHESWLQLADRLLARWAGVYLPQQSRPNRILQAIASPQATRNGLSASKIM